MKNKMMTMMNEKKKSEVYKDGRAFDILTLPQMHSPPLHRFLYHVHRFDSSFQNYSYHCQKNPTVFPTDTFLSLHFDKMYTHSTRRCEIPRFRSFLTMRMMIVALLFDFQSTRLLLLPLPVVRSICDVPVKRK